MRNIQDLLYFRSDISPFLIHLTRNNEIGTAKENLESIFGNRLLLPSTQPVSDARFAVPPAEANDINLFCAVSFSETPLPEVHSLFEIEARQINLEPYGLVVLKDNLAKKGVAPVIYINNEQGNMDVVVRALASLRNTHPAEARQILPLISVFGAKLTPVGGAATQGRVDFRWEREWRHPGGNVLVQFNESDVFMGLCPHDEIEHFEQLYTPIEFIDPRRNVKWYATKLIRARQRLNLKYSVV